MSSLWPNHQPSTQCIWCQAPATLHVAHGRTGEYEGISACGWAHLAQLSTFRSSGEAGPQGPEESETLSTSAAAPKYEQLTLFDAAPYTTQDPESEDA